MAGERRRPRLRPARGVHSPRLFIIRRRKGGRVVFGLDTNVKSTSGHTADTIDALVAGHGLAGTGQSFVNNEAHYGINSLFALSHAIVESAWGDSHYAQTRNNLFGLNAIDTDPDHAFSYPSKAACIDYYFWFLDSAYLTPGGSFFSGGTTIHNVFVHYSSSHETGAKLSPAS